MTRLSNGLALIAGLALSCSAWAQAYPQHPITMIVPFSAGGEDRMFHLAWQDWINLKNLIAVSRVIALSALAREDSRGAHFREDFPTAGALEDSSYIVVTQRGEALDLERRPVRFTHVAPGQSLLAEP